MTNPQPRLASLFGLFDKAATPVAQLVTRIAFGQAFALTGWGKLTHLDKITHFFESLGIPFANLQAPMIGTFEFVGGILLVLGLGTRFAALVLTSTMIVALATAHGADLAAALRLDKGFDEAAPIPYLIATLWLLAKGAGKLSIDQMLARKHGRAAAAG
jgi:putative oxidoreductase